MLGPWLNCPKCLSSMDRERHRGIDLQRCSHCRGWWIDRSALVVCLAAVKPPVAPGETVELIKKLEGKPAALFCPACSTSELKVGLYKQLELEFCRRCLGIFLDAGELPELLKKVRESKRPPPKAKPRNKLRNKSRRGHAKKAAETAVGNLTSIILASLDALIGEIISSSEDS